MNLSLIFAALVVSETQAISEGDDCLANIDCNFDNTGLFCSDWVDGQYGAFKTCENC